MANFKRKVPTAPTYMRCLASYNYLRLAVYRIWYLDFLVPVLHECVQYVPIGTSVADLYFGADPDPFLWWRGFGSFFVWINKKFFKYFTFLFSSLTSYVPVHVDMSGPIMHR